MGHVVTWDAFVVSQPFDQACSGMVGEEKAISTPYEYLCAWLGVAPRNFGISVSTELPARLCAALEPSCFLPVCVPCREVYSTVGETTGILSLTQCLGSNQFPH